MVLAPAESEQFRPISIMWLPPGFSSRVSPAFTVNSCTCCILVLPLESLTVVCSCTSSVAVEVAETTFTS